MHHGRNETTGRRGQSGPLFAAAVFAIALIAVLSLSRFRPQETPKAGPRTMDLTEERSAMGGGTREAAELARLAELEAAERHGLGATEESNRLSRPGRRAVAYGAKGLGSILAGGGGWSPVREGASPTDADELVASPDVVVRVLGSPDGDFVFHRQHGWMIYRNGQWEPIGSDELPEELRRLYPYLGASGVKKLGDADYERPAWMEREGR